MSYYRFNQLDKNNIPANNEFQHTTWMLRKNNTRDKDGRYTVRLFFRHKTVELGDSRAQALRRFYFLQKKLEADPEMKIEYHKVMQEYLDLGHMSLVTD